MTALVHHIPETELAGRRLGRHIEHDPRSRSYAVATGCRPVRASALQSVSWQRRGPILDQGSLGSCVGNAVAGLIATDAAGRQGEADVDEDLAVGLYELATKLDQIPDAYPPVDTGSSGLAGLKAAQRMGYLAGYQHAFSWRQILVALQTGPAITGISWRAGCDEPDSTGLIRWDGDVRGGHELVLAAIDLTRQLVKLDNSWSEDWGIAGSCFMPIPDYRAALKQRGDVTVPVWPAP